ncbi:MAG: hypothetical protein ACFHWZ_07645 [Phycisphaerales bacterium]
MLLIMVTVVAIGWLSMLQGALIGAGAMVLALLHAERGTPERGLVAADRDRRGSGARAPSM